MDKIDFNRFSKIKRSRSKDFFSNQIIKEIENHLQFSINLSPTLCVLLYTKNRFEKASLLNIMIMAFNLVKVLEQFFFLIYLHRPILISYDLIYAYIMKV